MSSLAKTVSVKLGVQPEAGIQLFSPETCQRSAFQVDFLVGITKRVDFSKFVVVQSAGELYVIHPAFSGACNVLWYTSDGALHLQRVGVSRLIGHEIVT